MGVNENERCDYPGCVSDATAGRINDRSVCIRHIDWAMSPIKAFNEAFAKAFGPDQESDDENPPRT
jgi:hypothetical protein